MSRSALVFRPNGFGHFQKIGGKPRSYTFKFPLQVNLAGAGYATSLCAGDPVSYLAANTSFIGRAVVGAAANPYQVLGTFVNVEYTNTNKKVVLDNKWVANTPVLAGSNPMVTVDCDPMVVWEVQCNNNFGTPDAVTGFQGRNYNYVAGAPNLNTGTSTAALDVAAGGGSETWRNFKIFGLSTTEDIVGNAWSAPFPWVLVTVNDHVLKPGTIGVN